MYIEVHTVTHFPILVVSEVSLQQLNTIKVLLPETFSDPIPPISSKTGKSPLQDSNKELVWPEVFDLQFAALNPVVKEIRTT